jgi:hypothetical protein
MARRLTRVSNVLVERRAVAQTSSKLLYPTASIPSNVIEHLAACPLQRKLEGETPGGGL